MTPWTIKSMEFSRSEYWSGQPFPSPGNLPNPGIEPMSPAFQVDSVPAKPPGKPKKSTVGNLSLLQWIFKTHSNILGLPWWLSWLRIHLQCGRAGFDLWVGKIPWRRERLPTPVFWPGEFHQLYSPRGLRVKHD